MRSSPINNPKSRGEAPLVPTTMGWAEAIGELDAPGTAAAAGPRLSVAPPVMDIGSVATAAGPRLMLDARPVRDVTASVAFAPSGGTETAPSVGVGRGPDAGGAGGGGGGA
jgi:hypothetical protein